MTEPKYHSFFNPRPTKSHVLRSKVFRILRDYQEGTIKGNGTVVGMLDMPLTAVYDKINDAIDEFQKPRS